MKNKWFRLIYLTAIIFFVGEQAKGQLIFDSPKSRRVANYKIKADLDTESKTISGKMLLEWRNSSEDTISELRFHTYMNAFSNTETTFMKERDFLSEALTEEAWGFIRIEQFRISEGENLIRKYRYISPDDGNPADKTVMSVELTEPIMPGGRIDLEIEFTVKLPKIIARTGYADNFYMVGQWFPKIGVYENGAWNCHQFHSNSEFYADFGIYDVTIRVPNDYFVGAGGVLTEVSEKNDSTQSLHFRAEDVVDFAWSASPNFVVVEGKHQNTLIRMFLQPNHLKLSERYLSSVKIAMDHFSQILGPYPYPVITIIDPPMNGFAAGGMEYPMLITGNAVRLVPKGFRITEMITIHEFGHQYFMALIASDEANTPWLDEGINSYMESRIMDDAYGYGRSLVDFWGLKVGNAENQRNSYIHSSMADIGIVNRAAWEYPYGGYGVMNYNKPAAFLTGLERMLGRDCMDEALKEYYQQYRFKHPKTEDFIRIVKEKSLSEKNNPYTYVLDTFFYQFLNTSVQCDFAVRDVKIKNETATSGLFGEKNVYSFKEESKNIITEIILERRGRFTIPTEVEMIFNNGDTVRKVWDGKARLKSYTFTGTAQLNSVVIDPEQKIFFDANLNNNSYTVKPQKDGIKKYVQKVLFWLQNIMQFITFF